jgi:2-polyprenyl-3-methyl-5-hydroxy-6-metoxy-1,4-benzoquinol methylase
MASAVRSQLGYTAHCVRDVSGVLDSKDREVMGSPYEFKADPYSSHSVILSCLGEGRGLRLLDVGAANGYLAERLGARGFEVTCIESDRSLAARASTKCSALVLPIWTCPYQRSKDSST